MAAEETKHFIVGTVPCHSLWRAPWRSTCVVVSAIHRFWLSSNINSNSKPRRHRIGSPRTTRKRSSQPTTTTSSWPMITRRSPKLSMNKMIAVSMAMTTTATKKKRQTTTTARTTILISMKKANNHQTSKPNFPFSLFRTCHFQILFSLSGPFRSRVLCTSLNYSLYFHHGLSRPQPPPPPVFSSSLLSGYYYFSLSLVCPRLIDLFTIQSNKHGTVAAWLFIEYMYMMLLDESDEQSLLSMISLSHSLPRLSSLLYVYAYIYIFTNHFSCSLVIFGKKRTALSFPSLVHVCVCVCI